MKRKSQVFSGLGVRSVLFFLFLAAAKSQLLAETYQVPFWHDSYKEDDYQVQEILVPRGTPVLIVAGDEHLHGHRGFSARWQKNGRFMSTSPETGVEGFSVEISDFREEDEGEYVCVGYFTNITDGEEALGSAGASPPIRLRLVRSVRTTNVPRRPTTSLPRSTSSEEFTNFKPLPKTQVQASQVPTHTAGEKASRRLSFEEEVRRSAGLDGKLRPSGHEGFLTPAAQRAEHAAREAKFYAELARRAAGPNEIRRLASVYETLGTKPEPEVVSATLPHLPLKLETSRKDGSFGIMLDTVELTEKAISLLPEEQQFDARAASIPAAFWTGGGPKALRYAMEDVERRIEELLRLPR